VAGGPSPALSRTSEFSFQQFPVMHHIFDVEWLLGCFVFPMLLGNHTLHMVNAI
jgi:hypothetical protein